MGLIFVLPADPFSYNYNCVRSDMLFPYDAVI